MMGLAADFDTWGVPSRTFLIFYLVATVVLVTGVLIHRRALLAGRSAPPADQLGPQQVAYLNGGEDLAVWTSLSTLRSQGSIGVQPDRQLTTEGPLPPGATPLDRAVHYAAAQHTTARQLRGTEWVDRALVELRDGLDRRGLVVGPNRRTALRMGPLLLVALLLLGVFRIVAGLANDRPVWYLVLIVCGLAVVTTVLFVRVPRRTRAADVAVRSLRQRNRHLAPASHPAYAVYGAAGLAMAVALYGTASLWALDPTFAQQAEIQRQAMTGGGTSTTSSCGSGSTAGASCGSSCGGGGGGGGGGGCGGGGCGG
ncbi:TIGR04222 domain-containing membrane protein [Micromonospora sp. NPDC051296]|uniref:TIGR04222 domain-containing membrane protein n=1 Tax=Micromonospora sp. NPDC051296 TaxID=3155046 RepID=UPI0034141787